jgi:hypothetical protein
MDRITNTHVYFWGSELSNWYGCKFIHDNHEFNNSEQAFMWEKAKFFGDDETAELILNTPDPRTAKELGRQVKNFNRELWLKRGYDAMVIVNLAKYKQNNHLKNILLSTDNKILVEASPVDTIWGIGLHWNDDDCLDESNWNGMNLLGKALMEVREKIKINYE